MDELVNVLELATDEELHQLADILYRRKFNPLDYVAMPHVMEVQSLDRDELVTKLVERFRFLAADGVSILRGKTDSLSYRQVLEKVCQHLKIKYSQSQTIADLESELFLNLLSRTWEKLPSRQRDSLNDSLQTSLQTVVTESHLQKSLKMQKNPLSLLVKGGGAIALSTVVQPAVMHMLAKQLAWHLASYQVSREVIKAGGTAIAGRIQAYFASRGIAATAARFGLARTAFSVITPTLWGWFLADLGWRAISTNYGRIIPVIFTLAQIRLLRG
jgi:uncharacterized protein YaaW (UPF0174 family)